MPFRSQATLDEWLDDFNVAQPHDPRPEVATQEEQDGGDNGLVVLNFRNVTTVAFLQPDGVGSTRWQLTFEAQPDITEIDGAGLRDLAAELTYAADLCDYLQMRSLGHLEQRPGATTGTNGEAS